MGRVYELTTHIKAVKRSDGRTATSAAAYRASCVIECDREGRTHDYSRKQGLEAARIVLPSGAPAWAADRAKLWNAAEMREQNKDKRAKAKEKLNAQTAREFLFSFPAELSAAGRLKAAGTIARHLADTHGVAADFSIHEPGKEGDQRNYHCHMLTTTRRLTAKGLGEKAREWDDLKNAPALAKRFRAFVAQTLNDELKAEGKAEAVTVEYRSFKERGDGQPATRHQGPLKTNTDRKKRQRARADWQAQERRAQTERHAKERAGLKVRQDFNLQAKLADLAAREKAGIAAIREDLKAQQAADTAPKGASRIFQKITGQAMRADFEREARHAQRAQDAERQIVEFKAAIQKERSDYVAGQKRDDDALRARHGSEDQQLRQAVSARHDLDRAAEREARREEVRSHSRERDHGRGRAPGDDLSP